LLPFNSSRLEIFNVIPFHNVGDDYCPVFVDLLTKDYTYDHNFHNFPIWICKGHKHPNHTAYLGEETVCGLVHLLCNLPEEFSRADITMHSHPNDTTKSMQTYTFALDFALIVLESQHL
jgi:hypothetical protein